MFFFFKEEGLTLTIDKKRNKVKVRGVFLMPSNGKNATNFFPHLIDT